MKYGLYDTKDNCWLGDDNGPKSHDDKLVAQIAAQIMEYAVTGTDLGKRIVAKELPEDITRLKDSIDLKYSTEEAYKRLVGELL